MATKMGHPGATDKERKNLSALAKKIRKTDANRDQTEKNDSKIVLYGPFSDDSCMAMLECLKLYLKGKVECRLSNLLLDEPDILALHAFGKIPAAQHGQKTFFGSRNIITHFKTEFRDAQETKFFDEFENELETFIVKASQDVAKEQAGKPCRLVSHKMKELYDKIKTAKEGTFSKARKRGN